VNTAIQAKDAALWTRLYLITDNRGRSAGDLDRIAGAAIKGGVTAIQFREKNTAPSQNQKSYAAIAQRCHDAGIPLLLNADLLNRFELSRRFDGVHYSNRTLPLHPATISLLSGFSAHAIDDARAALKHGISFYTLSPIFDTPTKFGILPPIGTSALQQARGSLPKAPIVALGGITLFNAADCILAGATGVAVIRAIMDASDPEAAARALRSKIDPLTPPPHN
jgi:thiamine-phosphate pyrophosphorylase